MEVRFEAPEDHDKDDWIGIYPVHVRSFPGRSFGKWRCVRSLFLFAMSWEAYLPYDCDSSTDLQRLAFWENTASHRRRNNDHCTKSVTWWCNIYRSYNAKPPRLHLVIISNATTYCCVMYSSYDKDEQKTAIVGSRRGGGSIRHRNARHRGDDVPNRGCTYFFFFHIIIWPDTL